MMRNPNIMKRYLIVILLLCLCFMNGCKVRNSEKDIIDKQKTVDVENVSYEAVPFPTELEGDYYWYIVKNEKVYITTFRRGENRKIPEKIQLYMSDIEGNSIQELALPNHMEFETLSTEFDFDSSQNIYYLNAYSEDESDIPQRSELIKCKSDGTEVARVRLADVLNLPEDENIDQFSVTPDGTVAVFKRNKLYLLNNELVLSETINIEEGELRATTICKNGDILCIVDDTSTDEHGYMVASLDIENKKLNELHPMNISEYYDILPGNGDFDLYYTDDYGIYGYDMEKEIGQKVFDYMASGVEASYVLPLGNGNYFGSIQVDEEEQTESLVIYTPKVSDSNSNYKQLTFATINLDPDIKDAIYEFNNSQSDIQIVIKDYYGEVDPVAKMSTDIIAGNIPDIFDLKELSVEQYVKKGLLEDLTPYYAKDESIHESDLIPSVLQAMKMDDKIYYVSTGFHVISLAAKVSDVGTADGWDYNDLNNLLNQKDADAQFFYLNNKHEILHMMLWCQSTDFVDKQAGECYFDSKDFRNLLRICNERGVDDEDYEWTESEATLLRNGEILFRDISTDIDYYKETMAAFGEDVNLIGLPSSDKQGNYINFSSQIGISSKSEYKEEAWEFLRTLMSKEYQGGTMSFENLPTRQDCFQLRMEAEMATEDYTNEMGREIFVYNGVSDIDGITYEIKPFTEEQAAQYVDMINRATKVADYDEHIMEIVQDEARHYFSGDKSLDDTVEVIQKRVTTYINEIQ